MQLRLISVASSATITFSAVLVLSFTLTQRSRRRIKRFVSIGADSLRLPDVEVPQSGDSVNCLYGTLNFTIPLLASGQLSSTSELARPSLTLPRPLSPGLLGDGSCEAWKFNFLSSSSSL